MNNPLSAFRDWEYLTIILGIQIFRRHHRTPCDDGGMVAKSDQA